MFDDLVVGISGKVIGQQSKSSSKPKPISVRGLLLGAENVIAACAASFTKLEAAFLEKFRSGPMCHLEHRFSRR